MTPLLFVALLVSTPSTATSVDKQSKRGDSTELPGDLLWMIAPKSGAPTKPKPPENNLLRRRGRDLYRAACSLCHGDQGNGRGPLAKRVRPKPTNFRNGVFKLKSTPSGSLPTDEDLFGTITRGLHGTDMDKWAQLTEQDRWALVFHLKSFSTRFKTERVGEPIEVPIAPRVSDDLVQEGERQYVRLRCGACHGPTGAGDGPYKGQGPIADARIRDFTRGRFIRGTQMEDIYVTLRIGLEGTPMVPYSNLNDQDIWAVAAYVRAMIRERPLHEMPPAGQKAAWLSPGRSTKSKAKSKPKAKTKAM